MKKIGGLFGRSVLGPLREHMAKVEDCLEVFHKVAAKYVEGKFDSMEKFSKRVSELEHEADIIKEGIRKSLSKSIFASSSRGDILDLIHKEDDISDACEDVVKFISLREKKPPGELSQTFLTLVEKVWETGVILNKAIRQATEYEEEEVLGEKMQEVLKLLSVVHKKEWETDQLQLSFVRSVFEIEEKLSPVDVFFLMNVSRRTVEIADYMENVADHLERVITG